MESLNYFASTLGGTKDARIFKDLSRQYGSRLENLDVETKLAIMAVLSKYIYFKEFHIKEYLMVDAIAEVLPLYHNERICNVLMGLQGLSARSCEILIKFIAIHQLDESVAD